MAPQDLASENLGQKHQGYNAALKQLITNNTVPDNKFDDNDINNLLKIDVASHNKDVDYILEVLKSDDMLYVSRALTRSTWLITDQKYAHIINAENLLTNLLPHMSTKAVTKLLKHIRHHIKDENRAEQFYMNEKNVSDAMKWLPHCSVTFIETKIEEIIKSDNTIPLSLYKRLCEKSVSILETTLKVVPYYEREKYLEAAIFILKTDTDRYLDALESNDCNFRYNNKLNHKATDFIMKHSPKRVIENIEKYFSIVHIPTFAQHFTGDEVKAFLTAQIQKPTSSYASSNTRQLFSYDTLKHFIKRLPKDEQFDFVKNICLSINEEEDKEIIPSDTDTVRMMKVCSSCNPQPYVWYQFAPFEQAFEEITKLYPLSANIHKKRDMLYFLIKHAGHNLQHIQDIIKYYTKHTKEESDGKWQIATEILRLTNIAKYDEKSWTILNELLTFAKIYEASQPFENYTEIVHSVIIYNILNGQKVPEVIEKLFSFDTLQSYRTKMTFEQQNKVFGYLYDYLLSKMKDTVADEKELTETMNTLENFLKLMRDWEKSFLDYPLIINKIKELIKLKKENSWKADLSSLYNTNKLWRKHMFEDSIALCPGEEVCLNALKHEPELLARHADEMNALRTSDTISLRRMLKKLRIYWPYSLTQQWTNVFMDNMYKLPAQKAAVRGICTLLPQKPLLDIIEKYKPAEAKINWKEAEEHIINLQQLLAKNMHLARPQPIPDAILSYAKGDYLQFALPSLLAIFYNLKSQLNNEYIPKLLDAPVSIQKHGIRLAFRKLDRQEIKKLFLNCWKISKNVSIRTIIFKYTFTLLCSEKDDENATSLWELLELFLDNLTFLEDKDTYTLLSEVEKVPLIVRAKFLVKSYEFLQKLQIATADATNRSQYQWFCAHLAGNSREVMDTISSDFVLTIIQDFIEHDFFNCESKFVRSVHYSDGMISVISAYLLCTSNEDDQIQKYEKVFVPLMQRSFEKWGEKRDGNYFIRHHFQYLLTRLSLDLKEYVTENHFLVPLKMFSLIQTELEKSLLVAENYLMLTKWKLTVALTTIAMKYSSKEAKWYYQCGYEFGEICLEFLKKDVTTHFSCIYVLFSKCLKNILDQYFEPSDKLLVLEKILSDKDFIQGHLVTIEIGSYNRHGNNCKPFYKQIASHPSIEVKMHYYNKLETDRIL